jgi:hypothetical protein
MTINARPPTEQANKQPPGLPNRRLTNQASAQATHPHSNRRANYQTCQPKQPTYHHPSNPHALLTTPKSQQIATQSQSAVRPSNHFFKAPLRESTGVARCRGDCRGSIGGSGCKMVCGILVGWILSGCRLIGALMAGWRGCLVGCLFVGWLADRWLLNCLRPLLRKSTSKATSADVSSMN